MTIIISKGDLGAQKLDKTDFEKEGYLQEYIHKNPEAIPVYEIQEDKKLFVAAREFQTESGPIDALAVDKDGEIYIVETKLYKNPDKRTVVAQALDYGASLWKHFSDFDKFIKILNERVSSKFNLSFEEKIKEFFDLEDEQCLSLLEAMNVNLREGNIKFVILMDSIEERLKDLILYVNQHSQFDIYAVQMEYYKYEHYEIMVPKLFGVEVKKNVKSRSDGIRKWTKEEFLQETKRKLSTDFEYRTLCELFEFTEKNADLLEFGTGKETGSITFKLKDPRSKSGLVSIFNIYTNGSIQFRFKNIKRCIGDKYVELLDAKISKVIQDKNWDKAEILNGKGFDPANTLQATFPNTKALEIFESIILEFKKKVKKDAESTQQIK